jgi:hypothetical protein
MGDRHGNGALVWSVYPKDSATHAAYRSDATYFVVLGSNHAKIFFYMVGGASTCIGRAETIDTAKALAQKHADQHAQQEVER